MKKLIKKAMSLTFAATVAFCSLNNTSALPETSGESGIGGLAAENSNYILQYNEETAGITVISKNSGCKWSSNPEIPAGVSGTTADRMKSQLILEYYSDQKLNMMTSYADSLQNEAPAALCKANTLSVTYNFGKEEYTNNMLPTIISKSRMEKDILPKLSDSEQKLLLSRYELFEKNKMDKALYDTVVVSFPVIAKHDIYVRGTFPDYVGKEIYSTLKNSGYTLDDLERDCKENEIENTYEEPILFTVTVHYSLTEKGLRVTVDPKEITYTSEKPVRITVLPYFGCANQNTEGYMLVPDGSGAVIRFNNGKIKSGIYSKYIYGENNTLTKFEKQADDAVSALPFFALSESNQGFLASIESGSECAAVNASVSGISDEFNTVYASFDVFAADLLTVTSGSDGQLLMISDDPISSPCEIEYLLTEGYTDYSAFARIYRERLKEIGAIKKNKDNNGPMNIEFIGTALVNKSFLGFSYEGLAPLTTLKQAEEITDALNFNNVSVRFKNAVNDGKKQNSVSKVKFDSSVGNKKDWKRLSSKVSQLSLSMNVQTVAKASKKETSRKMDNSIAKQYTYDPVSRYMQSRSYSVLVSPSTLMKSAIKLIKSAEKMGVTSVSVSDIVCSVSADYNKSGVYDPAQTRAIYEKYLGKLKGEGLNIQSDAAGVYAFPYISKIWNVPMQSSNYLIEDESVPFYSMVIRGKIPYVGSPVNCSSDRQSEFLRSVEIGAGLQFSWIAANAENIVNSEERYYDRLYTDTADIAADCEKRYTELYDILRDAEILSHLKAENNVSITEYSNGVKVYVNFSENAAEIDGKNIPAKDFIYERE